MLKKNSINKINILNKNSMLPVPVVDWRITSDCRCPFCYGPGEGYELNTSQIREVIAILVEIKVEAIVITGGEPLLRRDIPYILETIKAKGIRIFLSTNGYFYMEQRSKIEKNTDVLNLPLDGSNAKTHDKLRVKGSYNRIMNILKFYSGRHTNLKIKVGTVVCKENLFELNLIENLLSDYDIDIWDVYQFVPYPDRRIQKEWYANELNVSKQDFEKAVSVLDKYSSKIRKIVFSFREDRDSAYFMINPNGYVVIPIDNGIICKDIIVGDILKDEIGWILDQWAKLINFKNYMSVATKNFDEDIFKKHRNGVV